MAKALSYKNQSTALLCKSMDWFLYDREQLRHEGVKVTFKGYSERLFLEKHIQSNSRLTGA